MSDKRLILLELNELCPHLVDEFIAQGDLPHFQRLRALSQTFVTHTTEEVLEPWIQWVTVHTGVPASEHGIRDLDEADKLHHRPFWDDVAGANVLLVAPMNVKFDRIDRSIFIPDPWAASQKPSAEVAAFCRFMRSAINNHARTHKLPAGAAFAAVRFLLAHGLTFASIRSALVQLEQERFGKHEVKWRRATILDRLLWDVFTHYWNSSRRPRVGVFFSNATAHYQHKYWAHHDPALFSPKPSLDELENYGQAIRFGYRAHDRLVGQALALRGEDTAIALCTALSQQPMHDYEQRGGKAMFLPKDYRKLLALLGATPNFREEALMAEEAWLHFDSGADQRAALEAMAAAKTSEGHALLKVRSTQGRSCIVGCAVFATEVDARTRIVAAGGGSAPFAEHFLAMPTVTTGKHHPDGLLWITQPGRARGPHVAPRLPLTEVRAKLEEALVTGSGSRALQGARSADARQQHG